MSVQLETRGDHVYVNQGPRDDHRGGGHRTSVVIEESTAQDNGGRSSSRPRSAEESRVPKSDVESDFELLANEAKKRAMPRQLNPEAVRAPVQAAPPPPPPPPPEQRDSSSKHDDDRRPTEEEVLERTRKKMRLLNELHSKTGNPRKLTIETPMTDIVVELEAATQKHHTDVCLNVARMVLGGVCEGIDKLNSTYKPFGVDMGAWKDDTKYKIMVAGEFDDPLLQLINEHRDSLTISPWMQIAFGLGFSFYSHLDVKKRELRLQAEIKAQQEVMRRQEAELRAHRMTTRRHEKEAWERRNNNKPTSEPIPEPVPDLQGPALTAEEMRRAMENEFVPDSGPVIEEIVEAVQAPVIERGPSPPPSDERNDTPPPSSVPADKAPLRRKAPATGKPPAAKRRPVKSSAVALNL